MMTDELVRGFIFSAHYQMFQFSVPLISLVLLQWFRRTRSYYLEDCNNLWFCCRVLIINLYSFFNTSCVFRYIYIFFFWKDPRKINAKARLMSILKYTLVYTICFITPTLVWSFTLAYYFDVQETGLIEIKKFNQFIWFWESYNNEGLHGMVLEMNRRLPLFFESLIKESWFYF